MLPAPYLWRQCEDAAYLYFNYGNVATVSQVRGQWTVTIQFQQRYVTGRCASLDQGVRHVERWILARGGGVPGMGKRRRSVSRRRMF